MTFWNCALENNVKFDFNFIINLLSNDYILVKWKIFYNIFLELAKYNVLHNLLVIFDFTIKLDFDG